MDIGSENFRACIVGNRNNAAKMIPVRVVYHVGLSRLFYVYCSANVIKMLGYAVFCYPLVIASVDNRSDWGTNSG